MRISKGFKRFLLAVALLGALAAVALAAVSSPWFHRYVRGRLITTLEEFTGGRVEVGTMRLNPFVLQITLNQLVVHGSGAPAQPALFTARTLVIRFSPAALLRRRLILRRLDLDGAEIRLQTSREGTSNLPAARANPLSGELPRLAVGRLTVTHTNLYWNNRRMDLELSALGVALAMHRTRQRNTEGTLSAAELRLHSPRGSLPATTFSSRFVLTPSRLSVTAFQWRAPGFTGQGSGQLSLAPQPQAQFGFQASGNVKDILHNLRVESSLEGSLRIQGEANFRNDAWKTSGRVQGHLIVPRHASLPLGRLEVSSHFEGNLRSVELRNVVISGLGGKLEGTLDASLEHLQPEFTARARLSGLPLEHLLAALQTTHPLLAQLHWTSNVRGNLNATWKGSFEDWRSQFAFQLHPPAAARPGTIPVTGSLQGSFATRPAVALKLKAARLSTPHSTLQAQGGTGPAQPGIHIEVVTSDFEEWRGPAQFLTRSKESIPLQLKAPVKFAGTVSDSNGQPVIRGSLNSGPFNYRDWNWDGLRADVSASPVSAEIFSGELQSGRSSLKLNGAATLKNWELVRNAPARFSAIAQQTPLAGLKAALGVHYPVTGLATGHLDLQGTASSMTGGGTLRVESGSLAGRAFDSLSFQVQAQDSTWEVQNIELVKGQAKTSGSGSYNPSSGAFSLNLHGKQVSLADFKWGNSAAPAQGAPSLAGGSRAPPVDGIASFDLKGEGTLEQIHVRADWKVRQLKIEGTPVGDFQGQLRWEGQQVHLEGESTGPGGTLRFEGNTQAANHWPAQLHGEFSNFKADPWVRLVMGQNFSAQVNASGAFSLRGPLTEPRGWTGESRVEKLQVTTSDLSWTNAQPVELHYADEKLLVSRFNMHGPSTNLNIGGEMHFGEQASLALTAQGESDAKLLSFFDPALQATGRSQADLRIQGSPAHPLLYGTLKVQDVSLSYGDLPFHLFSLNGQIRLEGDRAAVRNLHGMSGGGSVTVGGFVTLTAAPRIEIQTQMNQVRVQYPPDFTSSLSGTLRLEGGTENSRLEGELNVRQLTVSPNFSVMSLLSKAESQTGTPSLGVSSPVASRVRLNILVSSSPTVRLETTDLRLAADIDLRLQGTLATPVVVGSVHLLNGETVMRGNRYTINRGDITMSNPFRTEPTLDLQATTRIQQYDVTLEVSGPLDRIKLAYRSDPPLPTTDILSLLALGYSRQSEEMSTSGNSRTPTVGASALLSEALSTQMTGRIQRLFGVSRIKVDPNVGGTENVAGARVTVEQQVTRDLTLTYVTDTASSQRRVIQFEWTPAENFSILGVRDQNGIFGLEIRFRKRFR